MMASEVGGITFNAVTVIVLIGIVTYVCRFIGFWAIGFVEIGPRLRRSFELLPGCIAAASALPVAIDAGPLALLALAIAFVVMRAVRIEIVAIVAALGLIAGSRLAG
ncbi:MAG: AzlD domain-containing protein [Beijerinckiaceae bacterium]|nr:AzlD domain-containing protein [Beijerinckiaceae bacterium]